MVTVLWVAANYYSAAVASWAHALFPKNLMHMSPDGAAALQSFTYAFGGLTHSRSTRWTNRRTANAGFQETQIGIAAVAPSHSPKTKCWKRQCVHA